MYFTDKPIAANALTGEPLFPFGFDLTY